MSLVLDAYQDPVILLATDPNLNREKDKIDQLVLLIHNFPLAERKVSKLCQLSLAMLQTLEKIELNLKNWAFMSLDINSADHFHNSSSDIKDFNNSISMKVLTLCNELNKKLAKISYDLDYITKAQKTLSPIEFISDSGTLLTSLSLRNIKLKHELTDRVTVAYLKARLITIGTELEQMMDDDDSDSTVSTYKSFVATLLRQLNTSIEEEDLESKHECLAVINDMDKMFDAFKLERMKNRAVSDSDSDSDDYNADMLDLEAQLVDCDSDNLSNSLHTSIYSPPMIHSITKPHPQQSHHTELTRSESFGSMNDSTLLHKTTLSEEMPFLMSAFKLARNIEEDIKTYQEEEGRDRTAKKPKKAQPSTLPLSSASSESSSSHHIFPTHKAKLPETPLNFQSTLLEQPHHSPYSYLQANNSLLSRLGIKPQVVTAPRELPLNTTNNIRNFHQPARKLDASDKEKDKENVQRQPLTTKNLHAHTISSLSLAPSNDFDDQVIGCWVGALVELLDEALAPEGGGVFGDILEQLVEVESSLFGRSGQAFVDGLAQLVGVPRVDDDSAVERLRSTSKLRENKNSVVLFLTSNVLVTDQVHAVSCGRHQTDVGDSVQADQFVKRNRLVHEVNGHKLNSSKFTVDSAHQLVNGGPQALIFLDVAPGRHSYLYEHDLSDPLGVLVQEDLESVEFLGNTFDVIQAVYADNNFGIAELLLQLLNTRHHAVLLQALDELVDVDTDGEGSDDNRPALVLDSVGRGRNIGHDSGHGRQEVSCVVVGVEANEVAAQHALKDLLSDRQDSINFRRGKRCVKKEANADVLLPVGDLLAQHLGEEHQVVIMDPDQVVVVDLGSNFDSKLAVGLNVGGPGIFVEIDLARMVVEQGPQDGVGEAVVVQVSDDVVEENCRAVEFLHQVAIDSVLLGLRDLQARPSEPLEAGGFHKALESRHETARRHAVVVGAVRRPFDGDWESVGDHDNFTVNHSELEAKWGSEEQRR